MAGPRRRLDRAPGRALATSLAEAEREGRPVVLLTQRRLPGRARRRRSRRCRAADAQRRARGLAAEALADRPRRRRWRGSSRSRSPAPAAIWLATASRIRDARRARRKLLAGGAGAASTLTAADMPRLIAPASAPERDRRQGSRRSRCARAGAAAAPGDACARAPRTARCSPASGELRGRRRPRHGRLTMPVELRNRVARIEIEGEDSAGARAAARRALAPPAGRHRRVGATRARSRCSATPITSSARWRRSPRCAAARRPTC